MRYSTAIGAGAAFGIVVLITVVTRHAWAPPGAPVWDELPEVLQRYVRYVEGMHTLDVRGVRFRQGLRLGTVQEVTALADRVFAPRRQRLTDRVGGRRADSSHLKEELARLESRKRRYVGERSERLSVLLTPFTARIKETRERLDIGVPPPEDAPVRDRLGRQTRGYSNWVLSNMISVRGPVPRTASWPGPDLRQQRGHLAHLSLAVLIRRWPITGSSVVEGGKRYEFARPASTESLPGSYRRCTTVAAVFSESEGLPTRIELFREEGLFAVVEIEEYDEDFGRGVMWPRRVIWNTYDEGLKQGERACVSTMEIEYHLVEINGEVPDWIFEDPGLAETDEELFPTFAFEGAAS